MASMFGTFRGFPIGGFRGFAPDHPTFGPAYGDSGVENLIGAKGYDGGIHNSPFSGGDGRIKGAFAAPGPYNPFMFMRPRRRRLNVLSIIQCVALPTAIFAVIAWLFSFSVHEWAPGWCWCAVGFCAVLSLIFLVKAFLVRRQQHHELWTVPWYLRTDDDTWYLFLGAAVAISAVLGLALGLTIYESYTQPYYKLSRLHSYKDVDPVSLGAAYLDAGAINFKDLSYVETAKAVGYKDGNVYCAAPIKFGSDKVKNFDFWAVGTNCCDGFAGNFNCFENRADSLAHGGLRVIDDSAIPFYKLAVMQATQEFEKTSKSPLFFSWMRDPARKIKSYYHDAIRVYFSALGVFALLEIAVVAFMGWAFWKNRLWG